jgi:hypothetical protein
VIAPAYPVAMRAAAARRWRTLRRSALEILSGNAFDAHCHSAGDNRLGSAHRQRRPETQIWNADLERRSKRPVRSNDPQRWMLRP